MIGVVDRRRKALIARAIAADFGWV